MPEYMMTEHALFEMKRRGLSKELVQSVLSAPEQQLEARPGRLVLQSRVKIGEQGKTYLVRVFVDTDREPPEVVTAYRTNKVSKYWRE